MNQSLFSLHYAFHKLLPVFLSSILKTFSALFHSAPRMELPMDRLQLAPIDLGVDLRCGNGGMAEHLLDDAKIGSSRQ